MNKPTEIQSLLTKVKQASDQLKSKIHALDDQVDTLSQRRSVLVHGPLSKADYLEVIRADVQLKARYFAKSLSRHLQQGFQVGYPAAAQAGAVSLPFRYLDAGSNAGADMAEGAYYFYLEDLIVAGVERALSNRDWPADAVPIAERTKALQTIDGHIEALTAERDTFASELVACGLAG